MSPSAAQRPPRPRLSVIIPALDEAAQIAALLGDLQALRQPDSPLGRSELIVVDGGSRDATAAIAEPLVDRLLHSARGRARQMNAGAAAARGQWLWFVHADSRVDAALLDQLDAAIGSDARWGRFDVRLSGDAALLRLIEWAMNRRSRFTAMATGDQGIFVRRADFAAAGGYPEIALMEDLALSKSLRRRARPACLRGPLLTSSRRWERHGVLRTMLLMWRLRLAWFFGADPARLARRYRAGDGEAAGG